MHVFYIVLGFIILIIGGELLLRSAVAFSLRLKISKIIIGMTVVSLATSAPELLVSLNAALDGHTDFALGNVIGSNIANIGLVLGITVLLCNIELRGSFFKTDLPMFFFSSFLLYALLHFDKSLSRYEGIICIIILVVFLYFLIRNHRKRKERTEIDLAVTHLKLYKVWGYFLLGSLGLWAGSEILLRGALGLAQNLGISQRIISISLVSVGTSIPELAASVMAAIKKEKSISIGNLIGSNIFNILAVLGITASIQPITANDTQLLQHDIYWMLGFAVLLPLLAKIFKKNNLGTWEGIILLTFYGFFLYFCYFVL